MTSIWCPYSGKEWIDRDGIVDEEHIIPLSLGGHNCLTIKVNKDENNKLGTRLDGKIVNLPIISSARRYYNLKGHSKSKPKVEWMAELNGLRGRLDLTPEVPKFTAYRSKNEYGINVSKDLKGGKKITSKFNFDFNIILSFGCKVALGVGYYLFGDIFRYNGYHEQLRNLMISTSSFDDLKFIFVQNNGKGFWGIRWPQSYKAGKIFPPFFDAICNQNDKHLLFTYITQREIILGISLFSGFFKWFFNIGKNPHAFWTDRDDELGDVIEINIPKKECTKTLLKRYLENYLKDIIQIST